MSKILIEAFPKERRRVVGLEEEILDIAEMFSDTLQGENFVGYPATFVRLQHCTLNCVWCDTREVWRKGNPYTVDEILNLWKERRLIDKLNLGQKLVFTGGSPLLQQVQITNLINKFSNEFNFIPDIEIENECTLYPDQELVNLVFCWNNSPKLSNSAQSKKARYFPDIIREMSGLDNSWFKFVISKEEDWKEIEEDFLKPKLIDKKQIVLMPEGQTQKELQVTRGFVAEIAIRENIRFTDRLHITIWNKTVGV